MSHERPIGPTARYFDMFSDYEDTDWVTPLLERPPVYRSRESLRTKSRRAWDQIRDREARNIEPTRKLLPGEWVRIFPLTQRYSFLYGRGGLVLFYDGERYGIRVDNKQPFYDSFFVYLSPSEIR